MNPWEDRLINAWAALVAFVLIIMLAVMSLHLGRRVWHPLAPLVPITAPVPAMRPVDQPRCFPPGTVIRGHFLMCPDTQPDQGAA